jgi:hypothetical protein
VGGISLRGLKPAETVLTAGICIHFLPLPLGEGWGEGAGWGVGVFRCVIESTLTRPAAGLSQRERRQVRRGGRNSQISRRSFFRLPHLPGNGFPVCRLWGCRAVKPEA